MTLPLNCWDLAPTLTTAWDSGKETSTAILPTERDLQRLRNKTKTRNVFTRPIYNLPRPIYNLPRPIYNLPRPIYNLPRPIYNLPR